MKSGRFNNYLPVNPPSVPVKPEAGLKVTPPDQLPAQALNGAKPDLFKLLQIGQQLDATVIRQIPAQSILQLKIDSSVLNVQTELKLPPGTLLKIEVINIVAKALEFKLVSLLPETTQTIPNALKLALPRQIPISSFLSQIETTLSNKLLMALLPTQVGQLIKQFLTETPSREAMQNPDIVKKQFTQSGLFLEKRLSSAATSPFDLSAQGDRKATLLMLFSTLKAAPKLPALTSGTSTSGAPTPVTKTPQHSVTQTPATPSSGFSRLKVPAEILLKNSAASTPSTAVNQQASLLPHLASELRELISKTEGAISKIVLDQLASLPKEEGVKQSWQLELPFHNGSTQPDSLKLTITQEDKTSPPEAEAVWSVVLEITPPGLGTIYSKIRLKGNEVDSHFWSEKDSVCNLIENNLDKLKERFSLAGLETGRLGTRQGKPIEANPLKSESQIVSERA